MNAISPHPLKFSPALDPAFAPAALWNRRYRARVAIDRTARPLAIALVRGPGSVSVHHDWILSAEHSDHADTLRYTERLLKFLLWQKGAGSVRVAGADDVAAHLAQVYRKGGTRDFDVGLIGEKIFRRTLTVQQCTLADLPEPNEAAPKLGRDLHGCRIGFDLGGSDRKAAAMIDGEVVYSEETPWSPYFETDPEYHLAGVEDSLRRAAAHLPRVDAIGGSAAGTYVDNEVRAASLFRGVSDELFEAKIRRMFLVLQERWGGVPFAVANDGEVTALAGSMWLKANAVLGISMGTSQAAGYVDLAGNLTPWLNELAFAPVDYRAEAPRDEWSGDEGCGVQFFSQQAVGRLARRAGFEFDESVGLPERLVEVQQAADRGDVRALAVFETIGTYLGYSLGHYADFYDLQHVLLLGRVTSGAGGAVLLEQAQQVLAGEFPELHARLRIHLPAEKERRHGQAIAAAGLPVLGKGKAAR